MVYFVECLVKRLACFEIKFRRKPQAVNSVFVGKQKSHTPQKCYGFFVEKIYNFKFYKKCSNPLSIVGIKTADIQK